MMHWAAAEIGQPWVPGISDCWSFARRCWRERWGWDVPPIMIDPADLRAARHARVQREPARVATHDLDDQWAVM